jgi:neutral ceramidase
MRHLKVLIFLLATTCSHVLAAGPAKVGFAERDISPQAGMERPGGYGKGAHQGIHDPCKARAVVFDDGERRVALVGLDVCFIWRDAVLAIREGVKDRCSIEPGNILIGASHTHSGGPMGMVQPGQFDHAEPLVQKLAYEMSSMADPVYVKQVIERTVEAIVEADAKRAEAQCGFASGIEAKAAFNRRHRMKNGLTFTHPGRGNSEALDYAGPIDPEVGVIGVWSKEGQLLGCVVNFACHATTGPSAAGKTVSADYIYYIEKAVRGVFGPDTPVVFLNGASGDVTQVDNHCPHVRPWGGSDVGREVGGRVGAEAVKVLVSMWGRTEDVPVAATSKVLKIERRRPASQRVAQAYQLVSDPNVKPDYGGDWVWAKETVLLDALLKKEPVADVEIQALQVGPAVFVAVPAEYFCQYGLDIKKGSKFPFTYPVSLANGCVGYVPTEEAFGPSGGGYETRLTAYSNLQITAGTTMARTGVELANMLTPGPVPELPKVPPANAPWSYGNVPPQVD